MEVLYLVKAVCLIQMLKVQLSRKHQLSSSLRNVVVAVYQSGAYQILKTFFLREIVAREATILKLMVIRFSKPINSAVGETKNRTKNFALGSMVVA